MILDGLLQFTGANGDSPTATAPSTNVIDLHMAGIPVLASGQGARDMGIGDDPALKLLVLCTAAFNNLTSLTVALQGATDDGTGNPAAFTTWWTGPATLLATLTPGTRLYDMDMPRPPPGIAVPRFLRLNFTIAGTAPTAGTLKAWIVLDRDDQMYNTTNNAIMGGYPAGVTVAN